MSGADVTYVFDAGYLRPSLISAWSVLKHRPADITLRFLVTEVIPALVPAVDHLRGAFPQAHIHVQLIDFDRTLAVGGHVSATALARLNLPQLLEAPTLYLDGDTMVRRDIGPLFAPDPDQRPIAAVRDPGILKALHQKAGHGWLPSRKSAWHLRDLEKISHLVEAADYINSGVVLFDLPRIRALGLDTRMGDLRAAVALRQQYQLRFNDQNWLNVVFRDQIHHLAPEWNTLWGNRLTGRSPFPQSERAAFAPSRGDPAVVHFTGRLRPWEIRHPIFYPKRRPWLAAYKALQAEAEAALRMA